MKKISMTTWVFIAMVAGIILGVVAPDFAKNLSPISNIFLRLIKSIIAPLLFGTLVYGIAGAGTPKAMGRIGAKAFAYFIPATTLALFVGLLAVNISKPGAGLTIDRSAKLDPSLQQTKITVAGMLEHTVPSSIIDAMAKGEVLQIVVFSVMFGIACSLIGDKAKPMLDFCHSRGWRRHLPHTNRRHLSPDNTLQIVNCSSAVLMGKEASVGLPWLNDSMPDQQAG